MSAVWPAARHSSTSHGYLPRGWSLADREKRRASNPNGVSKAAKRSMAIFRTVSRTARK
jgi:urocanate hydratase